MPPSLHPMNGRESSGRFPSRAIPSTVLGPGPSPDVVSNAIPDPCTSRWGWYPWAGVWWVKYDRKTAKVAQVHDILTLFNCSGAFRTYLSKAQT